MRYWEPFILCYFCPFSPFFSLYVERLKRLGAAADKTAENLTCCGKFCPPKYFVCWKHVKSHVKSHVKTHFSCELYGEIRNWWKNFEGQNCRNFDSVPKILSAEILSDKVTQRNPYPSLLFSEQYLQRIIEVRKINRWVNCFVCSVVAKHGLCKWKKSCWG